MLILSTNAKAAPFFNSKGQACLAIRDMKIGRWNSQALFHSPVQLVMALVNNLSVNSPSAVSKMHSFALRSCSASSQKSTPSGIQLRLLFLKVIRTALLNFCICRYLTGCAKGLVPGNPRPFPFPMCRMRADTGTHSQLCKAMPRSLAQLGL